MTTTGSSCQGVARRGLVDPSGTSSSLGWLRKRLLGISPAETTFARRGFRDAPARPRLEQIGRTFVQGYHAALMAGEPVALGRQLHEIEAEFRGFAFEGAAMALSLLDVLTPWKKTRWQSFVSSCGAPHVYMAHVGVGWTLARLGRRIEPALKRLDPLLGWLVADGYGFHEGYFHWPRSIRGQEVPRRLSGYARRVFDQGMGRSLWFVDGATVAAVAATIASFPEPRRGDLWSGVGLACAYAGGIGEPDLKALGESAGPYWLELGQGAAFAAKARQLAGNPADHTESACAALCRMSADEAATLTDRALGNLPANGPQPAYEVWRQRIQSVLETVSETRFLPRNRVSNPGF